MVEVTPGMTMNQVSTLLADKDVIRSAFWFKAWSMLIGGSRSVKAGQYHLAAPLPVWDIAKRFTRGIQDLQSIRVTIPEGLSNDGVATVLSKSLVAFDRKRFLALAKEEEGYLFPDTYVFLPTVTEVEVISKMEDNFNERIAPLQPAMHDFGKSLHDILIMASLLEGEARTPETRTEISGILWNRLKLGMPLQVDAVFPYILGKNTYEITSDDLKVDSPYNTYLYAGLPPGPINNPGLDALSAAVAPAVTKNLYYLSDKDGVMHYAVTHEQHLINRAKYLGK